MDSLEKTGLVQSPPPAPYLGVLFVRVVVVAEQVANAVCEQELKSRRHVPAVRLALALDVRHGQHDVAQVPQRLDRRQGLLARLQLLCGAPDDERTRRGR